VKSLLVTLLLFLSLALASPLLANDGLGNRASLRVGPFLGGDDIVFDLRADTPFAPVFLIVGTDTTPAVPNNPLIPVIGVGGTPGFVLTLVTDGAGDVRVEVPTTPSEFAGAEGLKLAFQGLYETADGTRATTPVVATGIEADPAPPGYLVEVQATKLPPVSDTFCANAVDAADVDRDGHLDLVVAGADSVGIWINDGTGTFGDESSRIPYPDGESLATIRTADVDADGFVDIVTAGGPDELTDVPDRLWLNDGTGDFAAVTSFPAGTGQTTAIEPADVDGDGDLDLLLPSLPATDLLVGGFDKLYLNDGSGGFTPDAAFEAAPFNGASTPTLGLAVGDVDLDGDVDVYLARSDTVVGGALNALILNDGLGTFTDASATNLIGLFADNTQDTTLVDFDGDGDLDVVNANSVLSVPANVSNDVMFNDGTGVFTDDPNSFLEPNTAADAIRLDVAGGDLDADGDLDLVLPVHDLFQGADQILFLNDGAAQGGTEGGMTRQPWFDPGDFIATGTTLFDMDADGDLDVIITANGVVSGDPAQACRTRLLENTTF